MRGIAEVRDQIRRRRRPIVDAVLAYADPSYAVHESVFMLLTEALGVRIVTMLKPSPDDPETLRTYAADIVALFV
jgi:hypothetical protein